MQDAPPPSPKHGDHGVNNDGTPRVEVRDDTGEQQSKSNRTGIEPPKLDPVAYHGPVGEFVKKMDPQTEASGPALLMQGLVSIGNLIGRRAWTLAGARDHFTNLYAVTVGESATDERARRWRCSNDTCFPTITKGDERWLSRIAHGAASGTGLIYAMRDLTETGERETDPALRISACFSRILNSEACWTS